LQFAIIKPLGMVILLLAAIKNKAQPAQGLEFAIRLICAISIIRAIVALLGIYNALRRHESNPMGEHKVFWKLVIIKLLFGFIVLNYLIINSLAIYEKIPVDDWLCDSATQNSNITFATAFSAANTSALPYCEQRLTNAAFVIELSLLVFPTVLFFRHHAFDETKGTAASVARFLCLVFYPFDLHEIWSGSAFSKSAEIATSEA